MACVCVRIDGWCWRATLYLCVCSNLPLSARFSDATILANGQTFLPTTRWRVEVRHSQGAHRGDHSTTVTFDQGRAMSLLVTSRIVLAVNSRHDNAMYSSAWFVSSGVRYFASWGVRPVTWHIGILDLLYGVVRAIGSALRIVPALFEPSMVAGISLVRVYTARKDSDCSRQSFGDVLRQKNCDRFFLY